jgi:hypothetical protein
LRCQAFMHVYLLCKRRPINKKYPILFHCCPVKLCTDTIQAIIPNVFNLLSQRGDMDFQSLAKARREYVLVGSTPASMRVMALPNGWKSIVEK